MHSSPNICEHHLPTSFASCCPYLFTYLFLQCLHICWPSPQQDQTSGVWVRASQAGARGRHGWSNQHFCSLGKYSMICSKIKRITIPGRFQVDSRSFLGLFFQQKCCKSVDFYSKNNDSTQIPEFTIPDKFQVAFPFKIHKNRWKSVKIGENHKKTLEIMKIIQKRDLEFMWDRGIWNLHGISMKSNISTYSMRAALNCCAIAARLLTRCAFSGSP